MHVGQGTSLSCCYLPLVLFLESSFVHWRYVSDGMWDRWVGCLLSLFVWPLCLCWMLRVDTCLWGLLPLLVSVLGTLKTATFDL